MRYPDNIICLMAALLLCGCCSVSNWLHKQNMAVEEKLAASEVVLPAHPIAVIYDVESSASPRKQVSIFFDGKGMARVLEAGNGRDRKTLVDFRKQVIIRKDLNTSKQETTKIDPYDFPSVLNARDALLAKALCLGSGATRGFPYHRWSLRKGSCEWEVWTDDRDSFPIYYRSIKSGDVTTWTLVNSWVDGSTYDAPTFFSLEPDPPPPEPIKNTEETEDEAVDKEKNLHPRHRNLRKHSTHKSSNE